MYPSIHARNCFGLQRKYDRGFYRFAAHLPHSLQPAFGVLFHVAVALDGLWIGIGTVRYFFVLFIFVGLFFPFVVSGCFVIEARLCHIFFCPLIFRWMRARRWTMLHFRLIPLSSWSIFDHFSSTLWWLQFWAILSTILPKWRAYNPEAIHLFRCLFIFCAIFSATLKRMRRSNVVNMKCDELTNWNSIAPTCTNYKMGYNKSKAPLFCPLELH